MIIFCYNYRENQESKEIMEVLREPYDFLLEGGKADSCFTMIMECHLWQCIIIVSII